MSKELQKLIDRAAAASNEFHKTHSALAEYCVDRWGFQPSDRDLDEIIDAVLGGSGLATGMKAANFCRIMDEAV